MTQAIQRALASAAFVVAILPMSPAGAQTQQQVNSCLNKDDSFSPRLRIDGCTATILSDRYSGRELAAIYYHRGIAYAKKGQYDRAISDFDHAIRLDPDSTYAFNNRGAAYARMGRFDVAIADFDEAIRINPSYATTYNNRGIAYAKKGQYERAIEDFDQAIRLDPNDSSSVNNRRLAKQMIARRTTGMGDVSPVKNREPVEQYKEHAAVASANELTALMERGGAEPAKAVDPEPEHSVADPPKQQPTLETDVSEANESYNRSQAKKLRGHGSGAEPKAAIAAADPKVTTGVDPKVTTIGAEPKITVAPKAKIETAAKAKTVAAPKPRGSAAARNKSKISRVAAHPHHAKSKSALTRFFQQHRLIPDLRKVLKLASHRSGSTQSRKSNF
ncbi:MAG TPA: tetratricopeptide repeat protein [Xanthobacteraceae bacterium]|nr:tetratricopeptide repeat protein [Xanthobacteraceae bacterium]